MFGTSIGLPVLALAATCLAVYAILLAAGSALTFRGDDWGFLEARGGWDLDGFLRPHQEHWHLLTIAVYRVLMPAFGISTYVPYLAVALACHLAVVAAVYRLSAGVAGQAFAIGASVVMLVLGTGFENLFWAFQVGFLSSAAAGLWAFVALESDGRRRLPIATALLVVSVTASGLGIPFVPAVLAYLVASRRPARELLVVAPAVVIYAAWYGLYGSSAARVNVDPFTVESVLGVPGALAYGIPYAIGAVSGLGPDGGGVIAAGLGALGMWATATRRPIPARSLAALAGLVVGYGLVGLVRARGYPELTSLPRYTYQAAALVIVGLAPLVPAATALFGRLGRWLPRLAILLLTLALVTNGKVMVEGYRVFAEEAALTRAMVDASLRYADAPGVADPDRSLHYLPSPRSIRRIVASYGPLHPGPPPALELRDRAIRWVVGVPSLVPLTGATTPGPECATLEAAPAAGWAIVEVSQGGSLIVRPGTPGAVRVSVGLFADPPTSDVVSTDVEKGRVYRLTLPELPEQRPWRVRVELPAASTACIAAG